MRRTKFTTVIQASCLLTSNLEGNIHEIILVESPRHSVLLGTEEEIQKDFFIYIHYYMTNAVDYGCGPDVGRGGETAGFGGTLTIRQVFGISHVEKC